ncbi:MAG TPA: hypothetical protein PKD53_17905 [Chloroflexaceae bacterium]|nr:hypothetical protein [Chloroflexaceae bacterium]
MELVVMVGMVVLVGGVVLSTIAQRNSPPPTPVFVVRAEPVDRLTGSDTGISLVILLAVIAAAVWLL